MQASLLIGLCFLLFGAWLLRSVATTEAPVPLPLRGTVRLATHGTIEIELQEADVTTKRLTFVIRGPEVTSLPKRAPITFHFDVPVTQAALLETSPALRGETVRSDYLVTCELTRDPFSLPVSWHATLQLELESLAQAGRMILWNHAAVYVIYQLTPAALFKSAS
jgi:hypothetical protein